MRTSSSRLRCIVIGFVGATALILYQLCTIMTDHETLQVRQQQSSYTLTIPLSTGTIYDHRFERLTNTQKRYYAVVHPTQDAVAAIFTKLCDREQFYTDLQRGTPFVCEITDPEISQDTIWVLQGSDNPTGTRIAQHLIGYRQNGKGVAGLEAAYADWLSSCDQMAVMHCTVDGVGTMLPGLASSPIHDGSENGGIVTTLDRKIQLITEDALQQAEGTGAAAIVMDVTTGDLRAMASLPVYDPDHLADYLDDENAPFLNRNLCAYNVGSIFKLVIAATALEQGFTNGYMYDCSGKIDIYGQTFRCHKYNGHGLLDLQSALMVSCNPYFISISRLLSTERLHDMAEAFGFGQGIFLANGIQSAAGVLQSEKELHIEAEKANFSFGQGKLLATPLQIAAMTVCIANDGVAVTPRLLLGMTEDGKTLMNNTQANSRRVMLQETANTLQCMMTSALTNAKEANGRPMYTTAGGKTSTAQTGQYDAEGHELCHGWITGFFPADTPRYAVTVFVENGGYGNESAAPIFRTIIDQMTINGY